MTPVQQHFNDVTTLQNAGIPLTPGELAQATGGDIEDFTGVHVVKASPELTQMIKDRERRLLKMAGMEAPDDGGPIGAELLLQDAKRGITWLVGLLQNR